MAQESTEQQSDQSDKSRFPTIERAELAGGYFSKHVTFIIRTPTNKKISRRYSDFEWLRAWLRVTFPGAFIPPIPPKLPVAAWPSGYLLMRKRELQQFLHRCEIIPYLQNDETVKYFLQYHKNSDDFEKARKDWDKDHKRPSFRATYDKLVSTFSEIAELKTPDDMLERIAESRVLVESSIKQLDRMIQSSTNFVRQTEELQIAFDELNKGLTELNEIEYDGAKNIASTMLTDKEKETNDNIDMTVASNNNGNSKRVLSSDYVIDKRLDMTMNVKQWEIFNKTQSTMVEGFIDPTLKRSIFDLKVIRDILNTRDKLNNEYAQAQAIAQRWKTNYSQENLRASQIATKHRDMQREEDLSLLTTMVNKLSLAQLNLVFSANIRRWHKAQKSVVDHHSLGLEKILGSWRSLINKCIEEGGNPNAINQIYKALIVEDLDEKENGKQSVKKNENERNESKMDEIDMNDDNDDRENDKLTSMKEDTPIPPKVEKNEENENENENENEKNKEDDNDKENDMNDENDKENMFGNDNDKDNNNNNEEEEDDDENDNFFGKASKTVEKENEAQLHEQQKRTAEKVNQLFGDDDVDADTTQRKTSQDGGSKGLFEDEMDENASGKGIFGDDDNDGDLFTKTNENDNGNEDGNDNNNDNENEDVDSNERNEENDDNDNKDNKEENEENDNSNMDKDDENNNDESNKTQEMDAPKVSIDADDFD